MENYGASVASTGTLLECPKSSPKADMAEPCGSVGNDSSSILQRKVDRRTAHRTLLLPRETLRSVESITHLVGRDRYLVKRISFKMDND